MKLMLMMSLIIVFHMVFWKNVSDLNHSRTDKLYNIKHGISVNKLSVDELSIISLGFNIAFLNNTCKLVSSEIRKEGNRVCEYECRERLICREYTKIHDVFNVNFQYYVVRTLEWKLFLKNIQSGTLQAIPIENVM